MGFFYTFVITSQDNLLKKITVKVYIRDILLLLINEKLQVQSDGRRYYARTINFSHKYFSIPRPLFRTVAKEKYEKG